MNDGISPINILLVRGNLNDHRLTDDRLRLRRLANEIETAEGASAALLLLAECLAEGALPGCVVLDLDAGPCDTLVAAIRDDDALAALPLIVLTNTERQGIDLRVASPNTRWLTRPAGLDDITTALGEISDLSFEVKIVSHVQWHETEMWICSKAPAVAIDLSESATNKAFTA